MASTSVHLPAPIVEQLDRVAAARGTSRNRVILQAPPLGDMDVILGSVAITVGGGVATANPRDFQRMLGLCVDAWPRA